MGLEDFVAKAQTGFQKVIDYISGPSSVDNMVKYGIEHYLDSDIRNDLLEGRTEQQRKVVYDSIRTKIAEKHGEYRKALDAASLKIAKAPGIAAVVNDIYHLLRGTPFESMAYMQYGIIATKALLELPAMYQYFKKSWDIYGVAKWLGYKAIALAIPVLGPAIDYNSAQRIIRKGIVKEGMKEWLKDKKLYEEREPFYERLKRHVDKVTSKLPQPAPA